MAFAEFYDPDELGFDLQAEEDFPPANQLKIRLFPVYETQRAFQGDVRALAVFAKMGIPDPRNQLFGSKFKDMPGIVWSASFGSPSFGYGDFADLKDHPITADEYDSPFKAPTNTDPGTIRYWLSKYIPTIVGNVVSTLYFYNYAHNEGGLNFMFDTTEGTLLAHPWDVRNLLDYLLAKVCQVSLVEDDVKIGELGEIYRSILNYVKDKFAELETAPLYMILTYIFYASFRRLKNRENPEWDELGHAVVHPVPEGFFNYNLRIYFVKRRGRFVHESEIGIGRVPLEEYIPEINQDGDEIRLPQSVWLSLAQYYRFLPLIQNPFNLEVQFGVGDLEGLEMKTIQRLITRDGHQCTSTSFSAMYDKFFFNLSSAVAATDPAGEHNRVVMVGVNPEYKMSRHARLYQPGSTMVHGFGAGADSSYFGVLAGACWFFNYRSDEIHFDQTFRVLRMPFARLILEEDDDHNTYWTPFLVPGKDLPDIISAGGIKGFFNYGADEYILSELVAQVLEQDLKWNSLNLLFFNLHWISEGIVYNGGEYQTFMNKLLNDAKDMYIANGRSALFPIKIFFQELFADPSAKGIVNTFFHTFFGHHQNNYYSGLRVGNLAPRNIVKYNQEIELYRHYFTLPAAPTNADIGTLLDHLTRYDRPLYWKSTSQYSYNPRIKPNGELVLPTNRRGPETLFHAIKYKIDRDSANGSVPFTDGPMGHALNLAGRIKALIGGKRRFGKTRKIRRGKRSTRRRRTPK